MAWLHSMMKSYSTLILSVSISVLDFGIHTLFLLCPSYAPHIVSNESCWPYCCSRFCWISSLHKPTALTDHMGWTFCIMRIKHPSPPGTYFMVLVLRACVVDFISAFLRHLKFQLHFHLPFLTLSEMDHVSSFLLAIFLLLLLLLFLTFPWLYITFHIYFSNSFSFTRIHRPVLFLQLTYHPTMFSLVQKHL